MKMGEKTLSLFSQVYALIARDFTTQQAYRHTGFVYVPIYSGCDDGLNQFVVFMGVYAREN